MGYYLQDRADFIDAICSSKERKTLGTYQTRKTTTLQGKEVYPLNRGKSTVSIFYLEFMCVFYSMERMKKKKFCELKKRKKKCIF